MFVLAYVRISTEEQSHFSIQGQIDIINSFVERRGWTIHEFYIDEGASGRNFNRPAWKRLEKDLADLSRRNQPLKIVAYKYDRFIRNTIEGLTFIQKVEKKWNVQVISVLEPMMGLHQDNPYHFKQRASFMVDAEFERLRISDRSKMGNWRAKSEGRFIGRAPFGYRNERDPGNRPILVPVWEELEIIGEIIDNFLMGIKDGLIRANAKAKGFNRKSKDAIKRVVSKPVYYGLIEVPAYLDNPKKFVKSIAPSIRSESQFWEALNKLGIRPKQLKVSYSEDLPLRGMLHCGNDGTVLTGGPSRGRHGGLFWYYRCPECGKNYSAKKAADQLIQILSSMSLPSFYIPLIKQEIKKSTNEKLKLREKRMKEIKKEETELQRKINNIEQKYIEDGLEYSTYKKWRGIYSRDLNGLITEKRSFEDTGMAIQEKLLALLPKLGDMNWLFDNMTVPEKQIFLNLIGVQSKWTKVDEGYRTPFFYRLFSHNLLEMSEIGVLKVGELCPKIGQSPLCTPNDPIIEPLVQLLQKIPDKKKAG